MKFGKKDTTWQPLMRPIEPTSSEVLSLLESLKQLKHKMRQKEARVFFFGTHMGPGTHIGQDGWMPCCPSKSKSKNFLTFLFYSHDCMTVHMHVGHMVYYLLCASPSNGPEACASTHAQKVGQSGDFCKACRKKHGLSNPKVCYPRCYLRCV